MTRWNPDRWEAIKALFHDLAALPAAQRDAILEERTAGDPEARDALRRMLDHATPGPARLDRGALGLLPTIRDTAQPGAIPKVGNMVGPFEVVREVGRGGMGIVLEGRRREGTGVLRVAIKVLPPTRAEAVFAQRFASEQHLLQQLDHPGIARFVDAGWTREKRPWFAMDYVEGEPIDQWCLSRGVPLRQRVALVAAVCDAVQHAHDRQVLHRDIKPSNLIVRPDGSPVLVDFGIARTLDDNAPGTLTRAGFRPISLRYASPEHLAGEPLTPASDVYSLGALLFQLLTGHPPAHAQVTPGEALNDAGAEALGFPDTPAARAAMAPYDAVTRRALAWRVEDRFPTALALAEALRAGGA